MIIPKMIQVAPVGGTECGEASILRMLALNQCPDRESTFKHIQRWPSCFSVSSRLVRFLLNQVTVIFVTKMSDLDNLVTSATWTSSRCA